MVSRGRLLLVFALAGAVFGSVPGAAHADAEPSGFVARYAGDVPVAARGAVELAMTIWSQRIESRVPIEVEVSWGGLPRGVAAASEPVGFHQAAHDGPLVAVALANARAGYDLDPGAADIRLLLGSGINWHTALDAPAPAHATDMVTMVMHELAHGLGFIGSFRPHGHELGWGRTVGAQRLPVGLDTGLVDVATASRLTDEAAFANPSPELMTEATSGRVVWGGGARDSRGQAPVMYTPHAYEQHSSLVHFDDAAYPQGDPDALMTSLIRRGETIRRIGPATLGVLADLGWIVRAEPAASAEPRRVVGAQPAPAPTPAPAQAAPTNAEPLAAVAPREPVAQLAAVTESRAPQPVAPGGGSGLGRWMAALVALGLAALAATQVHRGAGAASRPPKASAPEVAA